MPLRRLIHYFLFIDQHAIQYPTACHLSSDLKRCSRLQQGNTDPTFFFFFIAGRVEKCARRLGLHILFEVLGYEWVQHEDAVGSLRYF